MNFAEFDGRENWVSFVDGGGGFESNNNNYKQLSSQNRKERV